MIYIPDEESVKEYLKYIVTYYETRYYGLRGGLQYLYSG